jgi:hypothetical protein
VADCDVTDSETSPLDIELYLSEGGEASWDEYSSEDENASSSDDDDDESLSESERYYPDDYIWLEKTVEWDPSLTDAQLKETFTPFEHKFDQWVQKSGWKCGLHTERDMRYIERAFPEEDNLYDQYAAYYHKWHRRHHRRIPENLTVDQLLTLIKTTPCLDAEKLATTVGKFSDKWPGVPDLHLGQSDFGGEVRNYAIKIEAPSLKPSSPVERDDILDNSIISVGIHLPEFGSSSIRSRKRGVLRTRRRPMYFLQIGRLMSCDPAQRRTPNCASCCGEVRHKNQWKYTGFNAVVELDANSFPTGSVFAIFNKHRPRIWQTEMRVAVDWASEKWNTFWVPTMPPEGYLYRGCKEQFAVAKLSESLENLRPGAIFNFTVQRTARKLKIANVRRSVLAKRMSKCSTASLPNSS